MSKSQIFWDKTAEKYARSPVTDEATYRRKLVETQGFFSPNMLVVEFGCGTGTTAVHHAKHVQRIDAIDISEKMLQVGRARAREAGIDNITFTRGTLAEFNAKDESFDAVLGLNVIHLLPDREAMIAEVSRILKPGGLFVSSTVCLAHTNLRFIKLIAPLGKMLGLMPDVFVLTEAELATEVINAGFRIERQWHHGKNLLTAFIVAQKR